MANAPTPRPGGVHDRPRLGEFLVASGYITPEQLQLALREQSSWGGRLGQNLVDQGIIDERTLAAAIARQLYLHVADLERTPPPVDVVRLVPVSIAERYGVVAIAVSEERGKVLVACVDPTSNAGLSEVRRATGLIPVACVATASQIDRITRRCYYGETDPVPSPDPQLDVTRGVITAQPDGDRRLQGLERRLDKLLDLFQGGGGS
jgi:type IV pilus assembly protein PilB